ncbi:MAG: hypothetical protein KAJ19_04585 [Gammaproteobacteria bacterium]|nr:hypothetical protein [Gammaproteobacteria bacterium]
MSYRCTKLAIVLLALCGPGAATADSLNMPGSAPTTSQPRSTIDIRLPVKGMSMELVSSEFGRPLEKIAPVGKPPITRWIFRNYTVYFEYGYVVHAVLN